MGIIVSKLPRFPANFDLREQIVIIARPVILHTATQCTLMILVLFSVCSTLQAERPSASRLLPEDTLLYIRMNDVQETIKKFNETSIGKMSEDEAIKPLIKHVYGSFAELYSEIEGEVGASLGELLKLPQREVCLALVARKVGPPVVVLIVDVKGQELTARKLIDRGEEFAAQEGSIRTTEVVGDTKVITLQNPDNESEQIIYFEKDAAFVFCTHPDISSRILEVWSGDVESDPENEEDPGFLAENQKFTTIMKRCLGTKEERPQFTWYADPIELVKVGTRGNFSAQAGLAVLPVIGLDGLQGAGGSLILATEDFDMITHLHVLMDNPRTGVLEMIALEPGDIKPEDWVPADAASYTSLNWDVNRTYNTLQDLVDSFQSEGFLKSEVDERVMESLGVDFEEELLAALDGRMTLITWMEKPVTLRSQATLVGFKLNDPKEFTKTLETIMEQFDVIDKAAIGTQTYYEVSPRVLPEIPEDASEERRERIERRREIRMETGLPCFCILGDYLIITDRVSLLKKVILTKSDSSQTLAKELDYKLIVSRIKRQLAGAKPCMLTFSRPEEGMKLLYEAIQSEEARDFLAREAEDEPFVESLRKGLEENPLPPFEVISQYLAPAGGMVTTDETGLHYIGFGLKRDKK